MGNRYPVALIVPRWGNGEMRIVWQEGTDEDFLRVLRPLVAMGEAVEEARMRKENAPEAGGAAPDAEGRAWPDERERLLAHRPAKPSAGCLPDEGRKGESIDPDSL